MAARLKQSAGYFSHNPYTDTAGSRTCSASEACAAANIVIDLYSEYATTQSMILYRKQLADLRALLALQHVIDIPQWALLQKQQSFNIIIITSL